MYVDMPIIKIKMYFAMKPYSKGGLRCDVAY